jgi:hypothetical protein
MNGVGHRPGWAWTFILEGHFTVVSGVVSFFVLLRSPRFFNENEKAYVVADMKEEGSIAVTEEMDMFGWCDVRCTCERGDV